MMPRLPSKPRSRSSARRLAERIGHRGEWWAALFLQLQLYRIRDRRYKAPVGEIDLVAERWGTIVFVEVGTRPRRYMPSTSGASSRLRNIGWLATLGRLTAVSAST